MIRRGSGFFFWVCLILANPAGQGWAQSSAQPINWDAAQSEAVTLLTDYLKADTSNPPGNESRGVEFFKKILEAEGIPYEAGESAPGRANLVARLKGSGRDKAIILLSHMDVVPVNQEFWSVDAFSGETREGYVWGRGAVDMKGQGIAQLMAFLMLHRNKVPLRRDVIFLATADEEAGGMLGAGWVVREHPEWIRGAGYLLNEGARAKADEQGRPVYFGLGFTEKTPGWLRLVATGTPGHGSVPRTDSAVNRLLAALERLRTYKSPVRLTPAIERYFESVAPYEPPLNRRLKNMRESFRDPAFVAELEKVPRYAALLRNTISITVLQASKKVNVIPPVASADVDCRLLPGVTMADWIREVKDVIGDDTIRVETILNFSHTESPADTPLAQTIRKVVKQNYPEAGFVFPVQTGFTDSHFFRDLGIVSYGFVPFALADAEVDRAHGNDERIPVKAFTEGVRLMWEVVYNFSKAE